MGEDLTCIGPCPRMGETYLHKVKAILCNSLILTLLFLLIPSLLLSLAFFSSSTFPLPLCFLFPCITDRTFSETIWFEVGGCFLLLYITTAKPTVSTCHVALSVCSQLFGIYSRKQVSYLAYINVQ